MSSQSVSPPGRSSCAIASPVWVGVARVPAAWPAPGLEVMWNQQLDLYTASEPSTFSLVMTVNPVWIFGVTLPPSSSATAWSRP